jgi:hypothetical protein
MNVTTIENDNLNRVIIFSVYQADKPEALNAINHTNAMLRLRVAGIAHKELKGVYTYDNGQTQEELSILTVVDDNTDASVILNMIEEYNQESFLDLDSERNGTLVYSDRMEKIGKLREVGEKQAKSMRAYSYCKHLDRYFVVA